MTPEAAMEQTNEERWQILRGEHAHLRLTIEAARTIARKVLSIRGSAGELQIVVMTLKRELLAHLADEERLLEPIMGSIDAWGPVRLGPSAPSMRTSAQSSIEPIGRELPGKLFPDPRRRPRH